MPAGRRAASRQHFEAYSEVAQLCSVMDIDPWLIDPMYDVSAATSTSRNAAAKSVWRRASALLLARIRDKYAQHGVEHDPFVIVKADAGTYGMGIMTVRDPSEVVA
jgi:glutamate--cysteine ligase